MKRFVQWGMSLLIGVALSAHAERFYFDDLKAPESEADIVAIQEALHKNLQRAREATVCVELKEGAGSGVIISPDGLVLSAAHVTAGVGEKLTVKLEDGSSYEAVSLGLNSENDAAMLKISTKDTLPFVELEPKSAQFRPQSQLGDWVFSIGHSGGFDKARGAVVRLGRIVGVSENTVGSDCVLIGGDSGGPLFNMHGVLVGIHSRVGRFASQNKHVPVQAFYRDWSALEAGEFVGNGPFAKKKTSWRAEQLGASVKEVQSGLEIVEVLPKGVAAVAGLQLKDVLVEWGGVKVSSKDELEQALKKWKEGGKLAVKYLRGKETKEVELDLPPQK